VISGAQEDAALIAAEAEALVVTDVEEVEAVIDVEAKAEAEVEVEVAVRNVGNTRAVVRVAATAAKAVKGIRPRRTLTEIRDLIARSVVVAEVEVAVPLDHALGLLLLLLLPLLALDLTLVVNLTVVPEALIPNAKSSRRIRLMSPPLTL
jgi:hypothetical protein